MLDKSQQNSPEIYNSMEIYRDSQNVNPHVLFPIAFDLINKKSYTKSFLKKVHQEHMNLKKFLFLPYS